MKRILDNYFTNALLDNIADLLLPYNLKLLHEEDGKFIKIYFKPVHWKEEDAPYIISFKKEDAVKLLCNWSKTKEDFKEIINDFKARRLV